MNSYLASIKKQMEYYRSLGDKTFGQLNDAQLFWQPDNESNSIAMIVKHMHGNMLSRWTDFLEADGEKEWRKRDQEFDNDIPNREVLITQWDAGWKCLMDALNNLTEADLEREIFIRNMGHTVIEAINRQLTHYSYHVGQIVFIGKWVQKENWDSLSIPKGQSKVYNQEKFAKPKRKEHFTDDL
jgi:hypothetical protein